MTMMSVRMSVAAVAILLLSGFVSLGVASEEKGTWNGGIADEHCGKEYAKVAKAEHEACAKSCVKRGAKWALATKDAYFILEVEADEATKHLGHEVVVAGELDDKTNTIKVTTLSMPEDESK
jgi:hypothetical protein